MAGQNFEKILQDLLHPKWNNKFYSNLKPTKCICTFNVLDLLSHPEKTYMYVYILNFETITAVILTNVALCWDKESLPYSL